MITNLTKEARQVKVFAENLYAAPQKVPVSKDRPIWRLLDAKLPQLTPETPVLIQAGTGAGKTVAVLESVIPFAQERGLTVWLVSSRAAISTQFKHKLIAKLGVSTIRAHFTPDDLRIYEDIGPVRVLTFHRLWSLINSAPEEIKGVGILVFDEVHALALDSTFVSFTGLLTDAIPKAFCNSLRIYLSATPEPILPALARAERHQAITIYRWPTNYKQFQIYYWSKLQELVDHFNGLPENERALIFVRSITEGVALQKLLKVSNYLLTAETKEKDPDQWAALLENGHLDCQILVATAVLDAGVSLCDSDLKHVACYGIDTADVIQQAGRKRLKSGDRVSLYLFSPNRKQLGHLYQKNEEILTALRLNNENAHHFLREYILDDNFPQARRMCVVTPRATLDINPLAIAHYERELSQVKRLLRSKAEYPMEACWSRVFRQAQVKGRLDSRNKDEAEQALRVFLHRYLGQSLKGDEKESFIKTFRQHFVVAFGRQKNDREDRSWGLSICRKKLESLNWGITIDSADQAWVLRNEGGNPRG